MVRAAFSSMCSAALLAQGMSKTVSSQVRIQFDSIDSLPMRSSRSISASDGFGGCDGAGGRLRRR